jgi:hypothetical protein
VQFRERARGHAGELLPVVAERAMLGESRPADVMAFEAICRAGGYTARAAELHVDLHSPAGELPANVTGAVDVAVRALAAQVAALEQLGAARPLTCVEQHLLETVAQRLADIESSRGRLLLEALKSRGLNKDSGRTLTAMFGGRKPEPPTTTPSDQAAVASASEPEGEPEP